MVSKMTSPTMDRREAVKKLLDESPELRAGAVGIRQKKLRIAGLAGHEQQVRRQGILLGG